MRPGDVEYFVVLFPDTGGTATWRLQQLETTAGTRRLTQVGTGVFRPCNHVFRREKKYRANFNSCADAHANDSTMTMRLVQGADDDPMWMTCAAGCCIID